MPLFRLAVETVSNETYIAYNIKNIRVGEGKFQWVSNQPYLEKQVEESEELAYDEGFDVKREEVIVIEDDEDLPEYDEENN